MTLKPLNKDGVYRVRLVTMSGKTFTKGPYILALDKAKENVVISMISDTTGKVVDLSVDKFRVPEIDYVMNSTNNALLKTSRGERWYATLAGGWSLAGAMTRSKYPNGATSAAPTWEKTDDGEVLKFDGKGNYLHFPSEVYTRSRKFLYRI